ncbi:hypothetical protein L204_105232 [Cryptococcus depauperatus]
MMIQYQHRGRCSMSVGAITFDTLMELELRPYNGLRPGCLGNTHCIALAYYEMAKTKTNSCHVDIINVPKAEDMALEDSALAITYHYPPCFYPYSAHRILQS